MSDVKIEHEVTMTRGEAAKWLARLAKELGGTGSVSLRLAESTVEVEVPDSVRLEVEIEVDGDEVELEWELTWSTARRPAAATAEQGADGS